MIRIDSYEDLTDDIVKWLSDYYWEHGIKAFVVGVSTNAFILYCQ